MSEVPHGRWLAAGCDHLLLVHTIANELRTAAKRKRRVSGQQQQSG
jgi:hypothetical protein